MLKADVGAAGPAWSDEQIRESFTISPVTIYRVRQTFVEVGFEAVLTRKFRNAGRKELLIAKLQEPTAGFDPDSKIVTFNIVLSNG